MTAPHDKKKQKKGIEKRRFIRFPFSFPVKHRAQGKGTFVESQSDNISLGGVMFFSNVDYNIDQLLDVEIHYTAEKRPEPFRCKSSVRWIQTASIDPPEFLVGVQFVEMSPDQSAWVENLVEECIESQSSING